MAKVSGDLKRTFFSRANDLIKATGLDDPESEEFQETSQLLSAAGVPQVFDLSAGAFQTASMSSNLAQAAGASAKTGNIVGLVVAGILVGVAAVSSLVQGTKQAHARAMQAAQEHDEVGRVWGHWYLKYSTLGNRKPHLLPGKALDLQRKLNRIQKKRKQGTRRTNKVMKLQARASALVTVMYEMAGTGQLPPQEVLEEPYDGESPEPKKSTLVPLLIGAFSISQLLG